MKTILRLFLTACFFAVAISSVAQNQMCILGDATKYGWDKDKSSPMTQDGVNPSKFYYNAYLKVGNFKFLKQNSDWVPSWNKGANETTVLKRPTYGDPDVSFYNATAGNYAVVLDTSALTLSLTPMVETTPIPFNTLFMVGGATPNGWDLGKATELTRNPTNPFEFSYSGVLNIGELKFPVNRNWGWNQDFFMRVSDTQMVLQNSPDSKWNITETGNYLIVLNVSTLAISIAKNTTTNQITLDNKFPSIRSTVVHDFVNVNYLNDFKYSIYNISGMLSLEGFSTNGDINVSGLSKGMYFLKVENNSVKFIKY